MYNPSMVKIPKSLKSKDILRKLSPVLASTDGWHLPPLNSSLGDPTLPHRL